MVLNNKGQVAFYLLMLGIVIVILALALAPVLKQFSTEAMNVSTTTSVGLDCSNSSIDDFNKANCLAVDTNMPFFFFIMIGIAATVLLARVVFE